MVEAWLSVLSEHNSYIPELSAIAIEIMVTALQLHTAWHVETVQGSLLEKDSLL